MVLPVVDQKMMPRIAGGVTWVELDGEIVVYDDTQASQPTLHLLNASASAIWHCCDGSATLPQVITDLAEAYDVETGVIAESVSDVLDRLVSSGLVEWLDGARGESR